MTARLFEVSERFPLSPSYIVTESGRIARIGRHGWLRPAPAKRGGYLAVSLWEGGKGRTWPVHQVVAITFHGPRPSPQHEAAHWDGDRRNNHRSNLRWATKPENEADKKRHGTTNTGQRNGAAKIADADISVIRGRLADGERQGRIARDYGVNQSTISHIATGLRYGH